MEGWTLLPTNEDPTGVKVEFRNLPKSRGVIRVYTLAGDLVEEHRPTVTNGEAIVLYMLPQGRIEFTGE